MKKEKNEFVERIKDVAVANSSDSMSDTWDKLVKSGAVAKVMKQEEEYKKSGGYKELDTTEDIEK